MTMDCDRWPTEQILIHAFQRDNLLFRLTSDDP